MTVPGRSWDRMAVLAIVGRVTELLTYAAHPAEAAGHSWFSASHIALLVSIAALVVSITVGFVSLHFARRSTGAAEDSAQASKVSAKAAEDSARASKATLEIERDRRYDELRSKLWGRFVPVDDDSDGRNARLEVHLDGSTPGALMSVLVTVPKDAGFSRARGGVLPASYDLGYPEASRRSLIRVGHPAWWRLYRSDKAHGSITAVAKCCDEYGTLWEDVEVPVSLDDD